MRKNTQEHLYGKPLRVRPLGDGESMGMYGDGVLWQRRATSNGWEVIAGASLMMLPCQIGRAAALGDVICPGGAGEPGRRCSTHCLL